jgi:hypothetical protein
MKKLSGETEHDISIVILSVLENEGLEQPPTVDVGAVTSDDSLTKS